MDLKEMEKAVTKMAKALKENPELMQQEMEAFRKVFPDADENSLKTMVDALASDKKNMNEMMKGAKEMEKILKTVNKGNE